MELANLTNLNSLNSENSQKWDSQDGEHRLEVKIQQIRQKLRPGQVQMADWLGGPLAVSAVPGAGKSTGMASAAAIAIARQYYSHSRSQLVLVTFTKSAAMNLKLKICEKLRELSLPQKGFVVYTLHGLALNIATHYPQLSGLELDQVKLITPNRSHRLISMAVEQWISKHPTMYYRLLEGHQFDGEETEKLRRQSVLRTEILPDLAYTTIHEAKSSGIVPETLYQWSEKTQNSYQILRIAAGLYEEYEKLMKSQGLIDYDDMILAALEVFKNPGALEIEKNKIFAVFEDEAQDSSQLQTQLLEILAEKKDNNGEKRTLNLVRVGDSNQAINSTFTPADPIYFREFCQQCAGEQRLATMNQAGRSSRIIIDAANFVLEWVNQQWSKRNLQNHSPKKPPFINQKIQVVNIGDPQTDANPAPAGKGLELHTPDDIHHTVELIGQKIVELFKNNVGTAAILVRKNLQGKWLAENIEPICKQHHIELYEVAETERHSQVPKEILALLQFCDRPHSQDFLKTALTVLMQRQLIAAQDVNSLAILPEEFLYPTPFTKVQTEIVKEAAQLCRNLLQAAWEIPPYQIIYFLASSLNYDQGELATADKLAEKVNLQITEDKSRSSLITALVEIVNSERFEPVDTENPEAKYIKKGQLTIITMHKAKGLDWDYVFLPFLHENLIPGKLWVKPQGQFLGDFSLAEVARAQIRTALHQGTETKQNANHNSNKSFFELKQAWEEAKDLKLAEEYRLLYVAMTRAKKLLWMSAAKRAPFNWTKPHSLQDLSPSPVFTALNAIS